MENHQHWQDIRTVLTNVEVFLSTTLKKEKLKKETNKQRLALETEVKDTLLKLTNVLGPAVTGDSPSPPEVLPSSLPPRSDEYSGHTQDIDQCVMSGDDIYDEITAAKASRREALSQNEVWEHDYRNIFVGLWDCKAEADDELEFKRGDFIHILSREYKGWWIGEKNMQVGLVPSQYLMAAYI